MVHEVDQVGIFWLIRPKSLFYPLTKSDKPSTEGESLRIGRQTLFGGGLWGFRFFGFGHFLDRFFGFRNKKPRFFGFGVCFGFRVFLLLAFGFRFPAKILAVFRIWYLLWFSVLPYWLVSLKSCKTLLLRKFSNSLLGPSTQLLFDKNA